MATYRMHMYVAIADETGRFRARCFNDVTAELLGVNADYIKQLQSHKIYTNQNAYQTLMKLKSVSEYHTFIVKCNLDQYNQVQPPKLQYIVTKIQAIDWVIQSHMLIDIIDSYC